MSHEGKPVDVDAWQTGAAVVDTGVDAVSLLASRSAAAAKFAGPAAQMVTSVIGEGANHLSTLEKYRKGMGRELGEIDTGYRLSGEYNPENESLRKLNVNTSRGIVKGVFLAIIAGLCMLAGGLPGLLLGIPACIAGSWVYDKFVGRSQSQDPLKVAGNMRQMRSDMQDVPPELMFALMADSVEANSPLRAELESRVKAATGTHKLHHIIDDPEKLALLTPIMHDPAIVAAFAERYNTDAAPDFFARAAKLYNEGSITTRAIMYSHSADLAVAMTNDRETEMVLSTPAVPPAAQRVLQPSAAQRGL